MSTKLINTETKLKQKNTRLRSHTFETSKNEENNINFSSFCFINIYIQNIDLF